MRKLQFISIVCVLTACQDAAAPSPQIQKLSVTERTLIPTHDEEMLAIAAEVPGFAGIFFDPDGALVIRLKTEASANLARAAVESYIGRRVWTGGGLEEAHFRSQIMSNARVVPAAWSFDELSGYFAKLMETVFELPGVRSADISESKNKIVLGVLTEADRLGVRAILSQLSIPESIMEFEQAPPGGTLEASLADSIRPVRAGHLMDTDGAVDCTIGFNAHHWDSGGQSSNNYFITASHCTNNLGGMSTPDVAGQPDNIPSQQIATEAADPIFHNAIPGCPINSVCRRSDAAAFVYNSGIGAEHATLAWPATTGTLTYSTSKTIVGSGDAIEGSTVHKVGAGTGRHSGTVEVACGTYTIPGTNKIVVCMQRANYGGGGGDSGAGVVMVYPEGTLVTVGIHSFVDSYNKRYFSTYSGVQNDLGPALNSGGSLCFTSSC